MFLGRTPVYDGAAQTQAYALFCADGLDDRRPFGDRQSATRRLMAAIQAAADLDDLITGKDVWIPGLMTDDDLPLKLSAHRTILTFDPVAMAENDFAIHAERLRRSGYRIALDVSAGPEHHGAAGLAASGSSELIDPFRVADELGVADVLDAVMIPVSSDRASLVVATATEARRRRMQAVAVGVDTITTAERFASSFDLCIGRYVFQPSDVGPSGSVDRLAAVQLLAELERPNSTFEDVERVIGRDPSLVLRMLALANSGMFSLPRRIDTTRAALVMLGLRNVRQLALAVTLHSVTSVAPELTLTALIRPRHCELLAAALGLRSDVAFTVGLLSLVGTFTGRPTEEALASLPLTTEVVNAIARQSGLLGDVLAAVLCCERGRISTACLIVDALAPSSTGPSANVEVLASTSSEAIVWAERLRAGSAAVAAIPAPAPKPAGRLFRR
jgi:c-di-GMP phosphodiesterase